MRLKPSLTSGGERTSVWCRAGTRRDSAMLRFAALLSLLLLPSQSRDSVRDYLGVTKPFFSPDTSRVVEVREGVTAYLPCQVYNRNNFSVSWIRIVQQTSVENLILPTNIASFILDILINYIKDKSSVLNTLLDPKTVTSWRLITKLSYPIPDFMPLLGNSGLNEIIVLSLVNQN